MTNKIKVMCIISLIIILIITLILVISHNKKRTVTTILSGFVIIIDKFEEDGKNYLTFYGFDDETKTWTCIVNDDELFKSIEINKDKVLGLTFHIKYQKSIQDKYSKNTDFGYIWNDILYNDLYDEIYLIDFCPS
jgi:hypothetical protein